MRFNILGPLEVIADDDTRVELGPAKRRAVLGLLLCQVGEYVPVDRLIDGIWGATPPRSAAANLRSYIHGLRTAIGPEMIVALAGGYALAADAGQVDVTVAQGLSRRARAAGSATGSEAASALLLRQAVGLWRGPAFADLAGDFPALAKEADLLEEQFLAMVERCLDAELDSGLDQELVPELVELVSRHPYHERFRGQLMLALYRSGRQGEALAVYRVASTILRRDLGVDPDQRLRDLHQAILRHDAELQVPRRVQSSIAGVRPAQLPTRPRNFTGRSNDLARLDDELAGGGAGAVLLVGAAGAGKTALALHWGHQNAARFPDGQLFVDLRGFSSRPPVAPEESLAMMLRALGTAPDQVPDRGDEAAALYRSLLAGRKLLVVADNAGSADQVRPLLPGDDGCALIATSRLRMAGLVASDGVRQLPVGPLSADDAVALLDNLLQAPEAPIDQVSAAELAEVCDHLPLALRIAAAGLVERPDRTIGSLVGELRGGHRLDALRVEGDDAQAVRAAFDWSYRALDPATSRVFRLLGLVPLPTFTAEAVAALAGTSQAHAGRALGRLADAHLVERLAADRVTLHDLLREYAAECADADPVTERSAASDRLLWYYVDLARAAARAAFPSLVQLPGEVAPREPSTSAEAAALLSTEAASLIAGCLHAAKHGPHAAAWLIADSLRGHLWHRRKLADWWRVTNAGAEAATMAGDALGAAAMALSQAQRALNMRDYPEAISRNRATIELCRQAGWQQAEASALNNLAAVLGEQGDLTGQLRYSGEALGVARAISWLPAQAVALSNRALTLTWLGRLAEARDYLEQAIPVYHKIGSLDGAAVTLSNLVEVHLYAGRVEEAHQTAVEAHRIASQIGRLDVEVHALLQLSAVCRETGDPAGALRHASVGRELIDPAGDLLLGSMAHEATALAYDQLRQHVPAKEHHQTAVRLSRQIPSQYAEAVALVGLAACQLRSGQPRLPGSCGDPAAQRALRLARRNGFRVVEGQALQVLADLAALRDDRTTEASLLAEVVEIQQSTGWC
jgi:DNA-binding SARP family transcriptional activator